MLKTTLAIVFSSALINLCLAQNPLFIPDTVSGANISLTIKDSTHTFFTGTKTKTIAYNGSYLGKTIILTKGQNVTLNVNNQLADTTTTHWHGLHIAAKNDGSPHNPIMAGQTWSPSFTVMDNAATYWYHPHLHGKTMAQVVKGAAGLIIVRDSIESALPLPRTYGVDDFPIIMQFQTIDNATKQIVVDDEMDNTTMVNGTINPYLNCPAQVVRLRLLNASSHRVFQLGFSDNRSFQQITSDGGLLNAPVTLTRLQLGSGERAEILVNLSGLVGQTLNLQQFGNELPDGYPGSPPMIMGGGSMNMGILDNKTFTVLQLRVGAATTGGITTIPTTLTTNSTPSVSGAETQNFLLQGSPMMSMTNFVMNGKKYDEKRTDFTTTKDKTMIWTITNQSMMAHPFHIHGNSFYILSINGATPPANMLGKKDVVIVPPQNGVVRLAMKYEDFSDPTMPYMFHCHILSHEDGGMMGQFVVNNLVSGLHEHDNGLAAYVTVYPNPNKGNTLSIDMTDNQNPMTALTLYNNLGQLIHTESLKQGALKVNLTNLSLANGSYLLKIETQKGYLTKKISVSN
jgi:blue copper oxidase